MRFLLALVMSFQFMVEPVSAQVGQKQEFSMGSHLMSKLTQIEAEAFYDHVQSSLTKISKEGLGQYVKQSELPLSAEETTALAKLGQAAPVFKEVSKGNWKIVAEKQVITFTVEDLYKDEIQFNGKKLSIKDLKFTEIEDKVEGLLQKKTSFIQHLFNNTIGMGEAHAFLLVAVILMGIIAAAVAITTVYRNNVTRPREAAQKFNQLTTQLNNEANSCENAANRDTDYASTFNLASDIGDRSTLNSATNPSNALHLELKKQIERGGINRDDCFNSMHQAAGTLKIQVPEVNSPIFQNRRRFLAETEQSGVPDNATDALIRVCNAYNRLGTCMSGFVSAHVNQSDIGSFKDRADSNIFHYQRRMRARRQ